MATQCGAPTPRSQATLPTPGDVLRRRASLAAEYPQYSLKSTAAKQASFLSGDQTAYIAGIIAVLVGGALVFFVFPKRDDERRLLMEYHEHDMAAAAAPSQSNAGHGGRALRPFCDTFSRHLSGAVSRRGKR